MQGFGLTWAGPLVGPECRRASGKGWVFVARGAAGLIATLISMAILWFWWINWNEAADPDFSPYRALRGGLVGLVGLSTAVALLFGPAVVAGSLSGEQERGSMGLLLTTRVNALEIVAGRLAGRLAQVGMILLAIVPLMLLLGFFAGIGPGPLLLLLGFGPALAVGASGMTAAVAVMSRRGRDALLGSYAIGLGLVLLPTLSGLVFPGGVGLLAILNPFRAIGPLIWQEVTSPALASLACWLGFGLIGVSVAVLRLRPNSLRWLDGDSSRSWRSNRRAIRTRRVGSIGDRPMLWKEIYVERRNSLGGFGRWLGVLAVAYLIVASMGLAGFYLDALLRLKDLSEASYRLVWFQRAIVDSSTFFGLFLQWAVGLRAAVAIVSERERGTWDGLLTSPLKGSEIVSGKLLGTLHALRWLILATVFAWSIALGIGAMEPGDYVEQLVSTIAVMAFMAAVGVRVSLGTSTVPTAMALTIGAWLVALIVFSFLALLLVGAGALGFFLSWLIADRFGLTTRPTPWFPLSFETSFALAWIGLHVIVTAAVVVESRLRFDRLAGRITPGEAWVPREELVEIARFSRSPEGQSLQESPVT